MIFGSENRYCLCYKKGDIGFSIYRKKYRHSYFASLEKRSHDNSCALAINSVAQYAVA